MKEFFEAMAKYITKYEKGKYALGLYEKLKVSSWYYIELEYGF